MSPQFAPAICPRNLPPQFAYALEENLTVQADGGKALVVN
jgi:hypothetical protein